MINAASAAAKKKIVSRPTINPSNQLDRFGFVFLEKCSIFGSSRICEKRRVDGNQTILVWHALASEQRPLLYVGPELEALVTFTAPHKSAMNRIFSPLMGDVRLNVINQSSSCCCMHYGAFGANIAYHLRTSPVTSPSSPVMDSLEIYRLTFNAISV